MLGLLGRVADDKHVTLTLVTNLTVMALGVVPAILAARLLGPTGRGELAAALVWSALLSALAQLGLPQALTFCTATRRFPPEQLLSVSLGILLIQACFLAVIGYEFMWILARFRPDLTRTIGVVVFLVPLLLLSTYVSAILQGLCSFVWWNVTRVVAAFAYPVAILIAAALQTTDVLMILWLIVAATGLSTLAIVALFVLAVRRPGRIRGDAARSLLLYGLRVHWGNLAWLANTRLDQLVISLVLPMAALGHYAVAASVAAIQIPISAAFASVMFARVARAPAASQFSLIRGGLGRSLLMTGGAAGVLGMAAPWLVPAVFGVAFTPAVVPAMILLPAGVVLGANYVISDALRGMNHPGRVAVSETAGVCVAGTALFLLVPPLGTVGAALACLCTYSAVCVLLLVQLRGLAKRQTHSQILAT